MKIFGIQPENRKLLHTIFLLAWPAVVQEALQTVVQYIDTAMVGRIGADASAAVGLTTTVGWMINSPMFAIGVGVLACVAESIGAGKMEKARDLGIQTLYLTGIIGIVLGALMVGVSPFLPTWLGADESIRHDAALYFAIVCLPMLFRASTIILGSVLRGAGDSKSPMYDNLAMKIVNIVCNYFFIYETHSLWIGSAKITVPGAGFGVIGAAIGTAISYCVGGILMLLAYYKNPILTPRGCSKRFQKPLVQRCLKIGIPVAFERVSTTLGLVVFISIVARLGTLALATHSIAITAEEAFYIPGYGMQAAASTLAGNSLGEGDQRKFRRVSRMIITIAVSLMTITGGLLFAFPGTMMSIFSTDPQVIAGGITILRIVAVSEPLYAAMIILEGLFNGIGDTKVPFLVSLISMWGVRIVGSLLCVHVFHGNLTVLWCCMVADNVTRCILLSTRYFMGSWKKHFYINH